MQQARTDTEIIAAWTQKELIKNSLGKYPVGSKTTLLTFHTGHQTAFRWIQLLVFLYLQSKKKVTFFLLDKVKDSINILPQLRYKSPPHLSATKALGHVHQHQPPSKDPRARELRPHGRSHLLLPTSLLKKKKSPPQKPTPRRTQDFTLSLTATQGKAPPLRPQTTFGTILIHAPLHWFEHCL